MSNHDIYVSLNLSKDSNEESRKSTYVKTKELLGAAYNAIVAEESMIPHFQVLSPFSKIVARDIEEAFKGDYKENYYDERNSIFLLPEFQSFEERLDNSTFDNMNIESAVSKYRFLVPFIIKTELSPGLAFGEVLLLLINILTVISVFINGLTAITMVVGGCSLFFLLSIVHFWYGISRYPSIWNSFVPIGLKGATLDRNFAEIREICGHHHNGHDRINSQVIPFVITLPFTILFHVIAFLVTMAYYLLRISRSEEKDRKFPDPVITSIFLSNALVTSLWVIGGKSGIVFATLTIVFNQKAYNSLLFKKNLKDFCISLVFGNLFVVYDKVTTDATEIVLSDEGLGYNIEGDTQQYAMVSKVGGGGKQYSPPIRSLPPLLGASSSSSANSLVDQEKAATTNFSIAAQQNLHSVISDNIFSLHSDDVRIGMNRNNESPPEIFIDETTSQQSKEDLQQFVKTMPASRNLENDVLENNDDIVDVKMEKEEHSTKLPKKKFLSLSRRMFFKPRNKVNKSNGNASKNLVDDELSVEFLNPSDIHFDIDTHPGTIELRNAISESIQRFKIKSYTLRKHNWVMNQVHGKSFFSKEKGLRRRKLKRKEIKQRCKTFHDKQLHFNSQLSGILDDLKNLKNNHNNSRSHSDHVRSSFANNRSLQMNEKADRLPNVSSTGENHRRQKENHTANDSNYQSPKYDDASTAKESLAESSNESTISTLTQSFILEHPDDKRSSSWNHVPTGEIRESNDKETIDSSSTFRDAINGLLDCTPWIDNINLLKETGSKEMRDQGQHDMVNAQNTSPTKNGTKTNGKQIRYEGSENQVEAAIDECRRGNSNVTQKSYWQNLIDQEKIDESKFNKELKEEIYGDFIPAVDLSSGKQRKLYPWRSDLQKKKIERARENRSQSKEVAVKQQKRVLSIWKKKKRKNESYHVVSEEKERKEKECTEMFYGDDRHKMVENQRYDVDYRREIHLSPYDKTLDHSYSRTDLRGSRYDYPEMNTSSRNAIYDKKSSIDYGRECAILEGMTDVCSHHTDTEQREDEEFRSDVKLLSTDRLCY